MFIQYPTRKREVPIRHLIPNLITTISLCCGLASIHFALKPDWDRAMFAILLAAVFDGLDGRAARLLKATSSFGAVLDSLADFLSFGVAPAMFLHEWALKNMDEWGLAAVMTFVLCSALRLARFTANVKPAKTPAAPGEEPGPPATLLGPQSVQSIIASKFFTGLPTPAAAGAAIAPAMLASSKTVAHFTHGMLTTTVVSATSGGAGVVAVEPSMYAWAVVVWTFLLAWLMVSRQPMFSFKKLHIDRRMVVPMLIVVGLLAVLAVRDVWLMVSVLVLGYLLTLPVSIFRCSQLLSSTRGEWQVGQDSSTPRVPRLRIRGGRP